jgi:hypothetical protein
MKQRRDDKERRRKSRIAAFWGSVPSASCASHPDFRAIEGLWAVAKKLPTDFEPYGKRERSEGPIYVMEARAMP